METVLADLQIRITQLENKLTRQEKAFRKFKKEMLPESERKVRKPSGFAKPTYLSPKLCTFLNLEPNSELARTEVTKRLLQYVKDNNLQNVDNKRIINTDNALTILLSPLENEPITYFNIQRLLKGHYLKPEDDTLPPPPTVTESVQSVAVHVTPTIKKSRSKKIPVPIVVGLN